MLSSENRRTFTYPDKNGYELTVKSIPASWGDVTVKQYCIDANNNFAVISTAVTKAATERKAVSPCRAPGSARSRAPATPRAHRKGSTSSS
jgi:hypothetical protein